MKNKLLDADCDCGHPWEDHVSGQMRPKYFCEFLDCDCQDFRLGVLIPITS